MQFDPAKTLKQHGLSMTAQRLAILKAVKDYPHSTADNVITQVNSKIGTISKQSVYDTLTVLSEKGALRCIQPKDSSNLYEVNMHDNHHHLVCRTCHKTQDVECHTGSAPCLEAADDAGFKIDEAEVIYWGICPDCQKAEQ